MRRGDGRRRLCAGASERRLGDRVGPERRWSMQRPSAPSRALLCRDRRRGRTCRRASQRWIGGHVAAALARTSPLPAGLSYVALGAGSQHGVALRSDGAAFAWGDNSLGQCNVPLLPAGLAYTAIAAGGDFDWPPWSSSPITTASHTLALRSDGQIVACGDNTFAQGTAPALPPGMAWAEIATGRIIRSAAGAMESSSIWVTTPQASATRRRYRPASSTSMSIAARATPSPGRATVRSGPGVGAFPSRRRRFRPDSRASRSRPAAIMRWRASATGE